MDRRTILKSAAAVTVAPVSLLNMTATALGAAEPTAKSELALLIKERDQLDAAFWEADRNAGEIMSRPDAVPHPVVYAEEITPHLGHGIRPGRRVGRDEIVAHFDSLDRSIAFDAESNHPKVVARLTSEARTERAHVLRLFDERQAAHEEWAETSGLRANRALEDQITRRQLAVEDAILAYPCTSMEDARLKAEFFLRVWDEGDNVELALKFIRSFTNHPTQIAV